MGSHGLKGILIFDSNPEHARIYPTKSALDHLEVAHAPIHVEGDLYILEYLSTIKNPARYRLITSDRKLSELAKNLKVTSINSEDFFSLLLNLTQKNNAVRKESKPLSESKKELERLENIFENRLLLKDPKNPHN
jgi:hypothetical protein